VKLLLENWRKYLKESGWSQGPIAEPAARREDDKPITKLRIFDFDETIAYTDSSVRVVTPEGEKLEFDNQEDWDIFLLRTGDVKELEKEGYQFDFSDYSRIKNPEENEMITKIIADLIAANKKIKDRELYIITARGPEAVRPIKRYLRSLDLDPREFAGIIGIEGASKRDEIERIVNGHLDVDGVPTIKSIHFFDDSEIHLSDVRTLKQDFPEIEDIRLKRVIPGDILNVEHKR
jgi:hypothetical protein